MSFEGKVECFTPDTEWSNKYVYLNRIHLSPSPDWIFLPPRRRRFTALYMPPNSILGVTTGMA